MFGEKRKQLIGLFSDHPRRFQLQHCLEISEITVYLRKNNQRLSDSRLYQETHLCNKVSHFSSLSFLSLFIFLYPQYLYYSLSFLLLSFGSFPHSDSHSSQTSPSLLSPFLTFSLTSARLHTWKTFPLPFPSIMRDTTT